jgi:hypothetical protein
MNRQNTPIPEPIAQLKRQLEQIRSSKVPRSRLPESLWDAAVELAGGHGIYRVAQVLRLDYAGLKKRLNGGPSARNRIRGTRDAARNDAGMRDRIESVSGGNMRIQWKAAATPDWATLLRAWRGNGR